MLACALVRLVMCMNVLWEGFVQVWGGGGVGGERLVEVVSAVVSGAGNSEVPTSFFSGFLWLSVVLELVIVIGFSSSVNSGSGVSGWGGGSLCVQSFWETQGVNGHRGVGCCFLYASLGMGRLSSCFSRVSEGI